MLDQFIQWVHSNGQFITAVIAILTPILPTMIVKVVNDKKLIESLKSIRSTEDLKNKAQELITAQVDDLKIQVQKLIENQTINESIQSALKTTQDSMLEIESKTVKYAEDNYKIINETLADLQSLIPDLKKEFYMIVGKKDDDNDKV